MDYEILAAAEYYISLGMKIFPVHSIQDGECTCGKGAQCSAPGKHPATGRGMLDATDDPDVINRWFGRESGVQFNIGIPAGEIGLVVDIDPRNGGEESYQRLAQIHGDFHEILGAVCVKTGGGGEHWWFSTDEEVRKFKLDDYPGIDFQGAGSYVLAPPSVHASGERYRFASWADSPAGRPRLPKSLLTARSELEAEKTQRIEKAAVTRSDVDESEAGHYAELLREIDPDCDYPDWIKVGQALHSTGWACAFDMWLDWSRRGKKFAGEAPMRGKWSNFKADGGVSVDSIDYLANQARTKRAEASILERYGSMEAFEAWKVRLTENLLRKRNKPQAAVFNTNFKVLRPSEIPGMMPPDWLTENVFPEQGVCVIYGHSGVGKTFVVLDHALATYSGRPFMGHNTVKRRGSVYLCLEGDVRTRLMAAALSYGIPLADLDTHLTILEGALHITEGDSYDQLYNTLVQLREQHYEIGTVYIDTLAQAMAGANENAAEDMGTAIAHVTALAREFDCLMVLVHHTGKVAEAGARGHSSLYAACDTVIRLDGDDDIRTIQVEKQKEGPEIAVGNYQLTEYAIPVEQYGADVRPKIRPAQLKSCIITDATAAMQQKLAEQEERKKNSHAKAMEKRAKQSAKHGYAQVATGWIASAENRRIEYGDLRTRLTAHIREKEPEKHNPSKNSGDAIDHGLKHSMFFKSVDDDGVEWVTLNSV